MAFKVKDIHHLILYRKTLLTHGLDDLEGHYGLGVKNPPANAGDAGLIPGLERSPGKGNGKPTPVFLPGKPHGQRNLGDSSPWSHESWT